MILLENLTNKINKRITFRIILQILIINFILIKLSTSEPVGFSYAKFSGPVSGPEKKIHIHDGSNHGHGRVDYVARPDYHFAYGVDDPKTHVLQNRQETRNGDTVTGEYSVVDPDGTFRVVKYTADKEHGFQAEIITDKKHGQTHTMYPAYNNVQKSPQSGSFKYNTVMNGLRESIEHDSSSHMNEHDHYNTSDDDSSEEDDDSGSY